LSSIILNYFNKQLDKSNKGDIMALFEYLDYLVSEHTKNTIIIEEEEDGSDEQLEFEFMKEYHD
jgi:hypothetical protein